MTPSYDLSNLDDLELVFRYVQGGCSPAERSRVAAAIAGNPGLAKQVESIRDARWNTEQQLTDVWKRIEQAAGASHADTPTDEKHRRHLSLAPNAQDVISRARTTGPLWKEKSWSWAKSPLQRYLWSIPMTLLLVIGAYLTVSTSRTPAATARTYTTRPGQRATIQLSDGTRIILAPQTSLVVGSAFGSTHRDVHLTGQALFDVTSTRNQPFVVHTGTITTRVLGTEFMVRHYTRDRDVLVAVRSGKITSGRRTPVVLTGNMVARITDSTALVASVPDLREYMAWTDGQLVFTKVTAGEIATVLGQWYGLTFKFADSTLIDRPLTGIFDDRDSQQEALQNLELMLGVRMVFDGNVVTLVPKRSAPASRLQRSIPRRELAAQREVGQ